MPNYSELRGSPDRRTTTDLGFVESDGWTSL